MIDQLNELEDELQEQRENSKDSLKLNKIVEEQVIENSYSKSQKPFNVFSPSQVGYCKRQMYNRKMDLTSMDRYIKGILHAGTVNHFWLEHNLPSMIDDRGLETERKFRNRINIEDKDFDLYVSGYADAIGTEGHVYDHKFTGAPYYKKKGPSTKDKRQVMMYLYSLDDVHTGQLEYVKRDGKFEKDDDNIIIHKVKFDAEEFKQTLDNMKEVAAAVKKREDTVLEKVNPFPHCSRDGGDACFYCDQDYKETKKDVRVRLKNLEVWQQWKEGEQIQVTLEEAKQKLA